MKINNLSYRLLHAFLLLIFLIKAQDTINNFNNYVNLNDLFLNYEGGFLRRGLLGQIALLLYNNYDVNPLTYFSVLFIFVNFLFILTYLICIDKFKDNIYLYFVLVLSPATIMFYFYDSLNFFNSQLFINLAIVLHCLFACRFFNNLKKYNTYLLIIIIPIIVINIFIYDVQLILIFCHVLISFIVFQNNKKNFSKILIYYSIILIPAFFVIFNNGTEQNQEAILEMRNSIINNFGFILSEHPESFNMTMDHGGNLNLKIGGMIKIFGIYFNYYEKLSLFSAIILSLFFFYFIFAYFIKNKIYNLNTNYSLVFLFFIPSLSLFMFVTDFGRSMHMILIHLISFFCLLKIDKEKEKLFLKKLNFFNKNLIILAIIAYTNFWTLTHAVGWHTIINPEPALEGIEHSSLMKELKKIPYHTYVIVDKNIFSLPKAEFMKPFLNY